jgi:hypothetical protein
VNGITEMITWRSSAGRSSVRKAATTSIFLVLIAVPVCWWFSRWPTSISARPAVFTV